MKKPKGTMQFIMMKMNAKPRGMREMSSRGPGAGDLLEMLSRIGLPMSMPMGHGPMPMEDDEMEDEMEGEDMEEEDSNEDLDTVELIKKLIKRLEEYSTNLSMNEGREKKRGEEE